MDTQGRPLGIVHRDVSPSNIMISFEGEVKLLDFGIVKATERVSKTKEGNVKGNVGYMSPEQARGLDVTNKADLFSLGLVMFELLSGEPFYQGAGAGEILYQAATGPTIDHLARIAKLPSPGAGLLAARAGAGSRRPLCDGARVRARPDPHRHDGEGTDRRDDARAFCLGTLIGSRTPATNSARQSRFRSRDRPRHVSVGRSVRPIGQVVGAVGRSGSRAVR
jgi:serine/threonine protein kinase